MPNINTCSPAEMNRLAHGIANVLRSVVGDSNNLEDILAGLTQQLVTPNNTVVAGGIIASNSTTNVERRTATDSRVSFNKMRKLLKHDYPGFSDDSLRVTLHSENNCDVLIVEAQNEFRGPVRHRYVIADGFRVDRNSISAKLKLGVLSVMGRTYKSSTPIQCMDLSDKTIVPVMDWTK